MRFHESLMGSLLVLVAGAMWFGADGLANPTMQPYGPGFFPKILAVLLVLASAILVVRGLQQRQPAVMLESWAREPGGLARVLVVPMGVALFVFGVDTLGFIVCAILLMVATTMAAGARIVPAIVFAVAASLVVHSVFYLGLGVQMPWGMLQPVRW